MDQSPLPPAPLLGPLLDTVALFTELQIPYALIGGIAAMLYGRARFTDDVDFIAATGYQGILAANSSAMTRHHFDPASTWKLYHTSGIEIDLWKDEHADGIATRARTLDLAGASIRIADPHDLIAMKLRAGRFQDDYDISEILRRHPIDAPVLAGLVTPLQLQKFHQISERLRSQNSH